MEREQDLSWRSDREHMNRDGEFWTKAIKEAGVFDQLLLFSDVLTGYEPPAGYGEPMVTDVLLADMKCDIYHTDRDGGSGARIFIHQKERVEP